MLTEDSIKHNPIRQKTINSLNTIFKMYYYAKSELLIFIKREITVKKIIQSAAIILLGLTCSITHGSQKPISKKKIEKNKSSQLYLIKVFNKSFKVSKKVIEQFEMYKIEKNLSEKTVTKKSISKKKKEEKEKAIVTGITKKGNKIIWDITGYMKGGLAPKKKDRGLIIELVKLLLDIASTKISPYEVKHKSTLFKVIKLANLLQNKAVIQKCATPLVRKLIKKPLEVKPVWTLAGHKNKIVEAVQRNNHELLSFYNDGTIKLWNLETGKPIKDYKGRTIEGVKDFIILSSGDVLCFNDRGPIRLFSRKTGLFTKAFRGHTKKVNRIWISSSQSEFISFSDDGTTKAWNLKTGKLIKNVRGHIIKVNRALQLPERYFLFFSNNGTIKLLNMNAGIILIFKGHTKKAQGMVLQPKNKQFVSFSGDGIIKIWDINPLADLTFDQIEFIYNFFKKDSKTELTKDEHKILVTLPEFLQDRIDEKIIERIRTFRQTISPQKSHNLLVDFMSTTNKIKMGQGSKKDLIEAKQLLKKIVQTGRKSPSIIRQLNKKLKKAEDKIKKQFEL